MPFRHKRPEAIEEGDLLSLVENEVREGRTIEFKLELPSGKDSDKKEFLADVSSFANASGGDLVFGVQEQKGSAVAVPGVSVADVDAEVLRLDSMIRTGISPRLPRVWIQPVSLQTGNLAIVLHVARSWAAPHMVSYQDWCRFYSRNSAGKYLLEVSEVRSAFLLSESVVDRIRRFRVERLAKILAGETPVALGTPPKVIVHVVPFMALEPGFGVQFPLPQAVRERVAPMAASGWTPRYNFDGFVAYTGPSGSGSYAQLFRNGILETVTSRLFNTEYRTIPGLGLEQCVIRACDEHRLSLDELGVPPPFVVMISLLDVSGLRLHMDFPTDDEIDRNELLVPEVLVETLEAPIADQLKPAFDSIWSACGAPSSPYYDAAGKRKK